MSHAEPTTVRGKVSNCCRCDLLRWRDEKLSCLLCGRVLKEEEVVDKEASK